MPFDPFAALIIPNAIEIYNKQDRKYFFASFAFRDAAFRFLTLLWRVGNELPIAWPEDKPRPNAIAGGADSDAAVASSGTAAAATDGETATAEAGGGDDAPLVPSLSAGSGGSTVATAADPVVSGKKEKKEKKEKKDKKKKYKVSTLVSTGGDSPASVASSAGPGTPGSDAGGTPVVKTRATSSEARVLPPKPEKEEPLVLSQDMMDKMKEVVSEALPVTPMEFYQLFFDGDSSSEFDRAFHQAKSNSSVVIPEWTIRDESTQARTLTYVMAMQSKLAPKATSVIEDQVLRQYDGHMVMEATVKTPDVMYGDSFGVVTRWSISESQTDDFSGCWMYVTIGVEFSKTVWVKSFIEKSAIQGSKDYFKIWLALARNHIQQYKEGTLSTKAASPRMAAVASAAAAAAVAAPDAVVSSLAAPVKADSADAPAFPFGSILSMVSPGVAVGIAALLAGVVYMSTGGAPSAGPGILGTPAAMPGAPSGLSDATRAYLDQLSPVGTDETTRVLLDLELRHELRHWEALEKHYAELAQLATTRRAELELILESGRARSSTEPEDDLPPDADENET